MTQLLFCYSPYSGPTSACLLFPAKGNQEWVFTAPPRLKRSHFGMPWPSPRHPILPPLHGHGRARASHMLGWCSGDVTAAWSKLLQKRGCFACMGKASWAKLQGQVLLQSKYSHRAGGRTAPGCLCHVLSWSQYHPPRLLSPHPRRISPISDEKRRVCKLRSSEC